MVSLTVIRPCGEIGCVVVRLECIFSTHEQDEVPGVRCQCKSSMLVEQVIVRFTNLSIESAILHVNCTLNCAVAHYILVRKVVDLN